MDFYVNGVKACCKIPIWIAFGIVVQRLACKKDIGVYFVLNGVGWSDTRLENDMSRESGCCSFWYNGECWEEYCEATFSYLVR